jgi:hypothetical protein
MSARERGAELYGEAPEECVVGEFTLGEVQDDPARMYQPIQASPILRELPCVGVPLSVVLHCDLRFRPCQVYAGYEVMPMPDVELGG